MLTTKSIVFGLIIMIMLGGFFGIMIWSNDRLNIFKKILIQVLVFGFIFLICAFGYNSEDRNWNDGYCVECGTKYECIGVSRTSHEYYYSCPNCFHKANH